MTIFYSTTIIFKIPEEHRELQQFRDTHDLSDWHESVCSGSVSYKKEQIISTKGGTT